MEGFIRPGGLQIVEENQADALDHVGYMALSLDLEVLGERDDDSR